MPALEFVWTSDYERNDVEPGERANEVPLRSTSSLLLSLAALDLRMKCYLEHANISVRSIDHAVTFLTAAFPHFRIRGGSKPGEANRWVHISTDSTYIALNEAESSSSMEAFRNVGVNHLGFVVDNADAVYTRLKQAGYREGFVPEAHPFRKRIYFHDADGLEWEFIQYLSDEAAKKNDYSL